MARPVSDNVKAAAAAVVAGVPRCEAAKHFNVDESAIYKYMRRTGLPLPGQRKGPRKVYPPLPEPYYFGDGTPLLPTP